MPRPRKNQEGPDAVQRMEDAFWEALAEKPYREITVGEIAQRARVNKNTFYYHFDSLQTLAMQALDHMLPREIASMFLMRGGIPLNLNESQTAALIDDQDFMERTRKGLLVVGDNGSHVLVTMIKDLVMQTWFDLFEIEPTQLTHEEMTVVKFTIGGLVEVMGDENCREEGANPIRAILNSGIVGLSSTKVVETLQAAQKRQQASKSAS